MMRRSNVIHSLPTPVSWALHIAALLVFASADGADAEGSMFLRREDTSATAPSAGGGFLADAGRHYQPVPMRNGFDDVGDVELVQEEDVNQEADAEVSEADGADEDDDEDQQLVEVDDDDAELMEGDEADQGGEEEQELVEVDGDDAELAEGDEADQSGEEEQELVEVDDDDAELVDGDEDDQGGEEEQELVEVDDDDAELVDGDEAGQNHEEEQQLVQVDDDDVELMEGDEAEEDDEEEHQLVEVDDDDDPTGEVVANGDEVIKIDTNDNVVEIDGDSGIDAVLDTDSVTDGDGAVTIEDNEKDLVVQVGGDNQDDVIKIDNGGSDNDVIKIADGPKDVAVEVDGNDAVDEVIKLDDGGKDDAVVKVQEDKKDLVVEVDGNDAMDEVIKVDSVGNDEKTIKIQDGEKGDVVEVGDGEGDAEKPVDVGSGGGSGAVVSTSNDVQAAVKVDGGDTDQVGNSDGVVNVNDDSPNAVEAVDADKSSTDRGSETAVEKEIENASGAPTDEEDENEKQTKDVVEAPDGQAAKAVDEPKTEEAAQAEADDTRGEVVEPVTDEENASVAASENEKLTVGGDDKDGAEDGAGGMQEDAKHENEKDEYGEFNDVEVFKGITSLSHHVRQDTYYGRCPCNTGSKYIDLWANAPPTQAGRPPSEGRKFRVRAGEAPVYSFEFALTDLTIKCGGSEVVGRINVSVDAGQPMSVKLEAADNNSNHHFCGEQSAGFVAVNTWTLSPLPAGPVFEGGTGGFACFKSPQLLRLRDGGMLAFAQARWPNCSDNGHSTIVFRRSQDRGVTWSPMAQLVEIDESARNRLGLCDRPLSMSNVVPIELADQPGRLIALYMRNNYRVWMIRSRDGGMSWGGDRELPTATPSSTDQSPDCRRSVDWFGAGPGPFTYLKELGEWLVGTCWYRDNNPYTESSEAKRLASRDWQWIGIGPGGAVQLRAGEKKGRILVPGYHSFIRNLDPHSEAYNPTAHFWRNTAETHTLVSDDGGETWKLAEGSVEASNTSRETNFFQLSDGAVYANSATLALGTPQFRTQARVNADAQKPEDVKLQNLRFTEVPQPLGGCQGSVAADDDDQVYVSGPNGPVSKTVKAVEADIQRCAFNSSGRSGLTVWRSVDHGLTFPDSVVVDAHLSADSSIQVQGGRVLVLYEQADGFPEYEMYGQRRRLGDMQIFDPDRIMFATLEFPPHTTTTPPETVPPTTQAPTTQAPATTTSTTNTPTPTQAPATSTSTTSTPTPPRQHLKVEVKVKKPQGDASNDTKKQDVAGRSDQGARGPDSSERLASPRAAQRGGEKKQHVAGRSQARGHLQGKSGKGRSEAKKLQAAGRFEARGSGSSGKGRSEAKKQHGAGRSEARGRGRGKSEQ